MVELRNSIVVSQGGTSPDEFSCMGATVTTSALEADLGSFDTAWFTDFNAGDLSLTALGEMTFSELASWREGDPPTDIDGDLRPTMDDTPDFPGADIP